MDFTGVNSTAVGKVYNTTGINYPSEGKSYPAEGKNVSLWILGIKEGENKV